MTRILERAMTKASKLPAHVQDQLGKQLIQLIADTEGELKWDETLAKSQPLLEKMVAKARRAIRSGKTQRKRVEEL